MVLQLVRQRSSVDRPIHPTSRGAVLVVHKPNEVVVWLFGGIDLDHGSELDHIAARVAFVADQLTIDASQLTFCDSTLLRFVVAASLRTRVIVRAPSRILTDMLAVSGLTDQILIAPAEGDHR